MFLGYIDPGSGFVILNLGGWLLALLLGFIGGIALFFKRILRFFKKRKKWVAVMLVIIAAVTGYIFRGVIMKDNASSFDRKIMIIGFDGLSPALIEPMMAEGKLPNFTRLASQGSYSKLGTTNPSQSPVAWAGFATGQNPGKNGMYDFIIRDPKNYGLNLSLSSVEKGKAKRVIKSKSFWQYASDRGVTSVILSCPVTFPPDEINGKMLSGMGVPDILGTEGTFSFYTTENAGRDGDIGGKVFNVQRADQMTMNLIGPKTATAKGKAENVKVPLKVTLDKSSGGVTIEYQDTKFDLGVGEWSGWQDVSFKLGLFRKMKGILKFYLSEVSPDLKLYASPINFDPRDPYFPISHPPKYSRKLAEEIGLFPTQGLPLDTWAVNEHRLDEEAFLEQANNILNDKLRIFDHEMNELEKGIFYSYFGSSDIIQHMFWRYIDEEHPLYEKDAEQKYREIISLWYRKMDDILGKVMSGLGEDDTLIILSDHGFDTFRRAVHVNTWLRKMGYLELKDPSAAEGAELLQAIDWSGTKAYALGFGGIYINQRGREGMGIVDPGKETQDLKEEISRGLLEWKDEKYDQPVVHNVYAREDIFWGEHAGGAPDLYIGFNTGYRASWQTAIGGVPADLIEDNLKKWSGDHLFDPALVPGVLFSNRKIVREDPAIYDIAPTVLQLIGYQQEELQALNLDGEPLF